MNKQIVVYTDLRGIVENQLEPQFKNIHDYMNDDWRVVHIENTKITNNTVFGFVLEKRDQEVIDDELKEDQQFIINALNAYWHDARNKLERTDLGDIERKNYEHQLTQSKRLMSEFEEMFVKQ